jgi:hypothetical protein
MNLVKRKRIDSDSIIEDVEGVALTHSITGFGKGVAPEGIHCQFGPRPVLRRLRCATPSRLQCSDSHLP